MHFHPHHLSTPLPIRILFLRVFVPQVQPQGQLQPSPGVVLHKQGQPQRQQQVLPVVILGNHPQQLGQPQGWRQRQLVADMLDFVGVAFCFVQSFFVSRVVPAMPPRTNGSLLFRMRAHIRHVDRF